MACLWILGLFGFAREQVLRTASGPVAKKAASQWSLNLGYYSLLITSYPQRMVVHCSVPFMCSCSISVALIRDNYEISTVAQVTGRIDPAFRSDLATSDPRRLTQPHSDNHMPALRATTTRNIRTRCSISLVHLLFAISLLLRPITPIISLLPIQVRPFFRTTKRGSKPIIKCKAHEGHQIRRSRLGLEVLQERQ